MTSVYEQSDITVEESNPSQESLVMSMNAGLKERSPSESGSYEYANAEQQYEHAEADNGSSSVMLEQQQHHHQQYGHFKQSNNAAVAYNAFGFLQTSAGPNVASNHEEY